MKFYRNTTIITETRETRITWDGKSAKLVIPSATVKHTGTYKVKFTNSAGSSESSAEVIVKGKISSLTIQKYSWIYKHVSV